jgi:hypothetical protein
MSTRSLDLLRLSAPFLVASAVLLGCPHREGEGGSSSAAPAASEAPAATAAAGAIDAAATAPTPVPPARPAITAPVVIGDAGVVIADAGVIVADAGAAKTDAGAAAAGTQPCIEKCQKVLAACLTPSFGDGGFPQVKDPAGCAKAADACRTACGR